MLSRTEFPSNKSQAGRIPAILGQGTNNWAGSVSWGTYLTRAKVFPLPTAAHVTTVTPSVATLFALLHFRHWHVSEKTVILTSFWKSTFVLILTLLNRDPLCFCVFCLIYFRKKKNFFFILLNVIFLCVLWFKHFAVHILTTVLIISIWGHKRYMHILRPFCEWKKKPLGFGAFFFLASSRQWPTEWHLQWLLLPGIRGRAQ